MRTEAEYPMKPNLEITDKDREMARRCAECPVCSHARKKQKGLAFFFVKKIEGELCPYCKAYEKVHGRKAHEPLPAANQNEQGGHNV